MATERERELPHPALQAILLCEMAIREEGTRKISLIGIFGQVFGDKFPLRHDAPVAIYARMMDAEGEYPMKLELVRLEDEVTIGRAEMSVAISDRILASEVIVEIPAG